MLCYGMYKNYYVSRMFITLYGANEFGKTGNDPKASEASLHLKRRKG